MGSLIGALQSSWSMLGIVFVVNCREFSHDSPYLGVVRSQSSNLTHADGAHRDVFSVPRGWVPRVGTWSSGRWPIQSHCDAIQSDGSFASALDPAIDLVPLLPPPIPSRKSLYRALRLSSAPAHPTLLNRPSLISRPNPVRSSLFANYDVTSNNSGPAAFLTVPCNDHPNSLI